MSEEKELNPHERALRLLASIHNALAEGTKHFDPETKKPLNTAQEILECIGRLGRIEIKPKKPEKNPDIPDLTPGFDIFKKITERTETEDGWLEITLECGHELLAISNAKMELGDEAPCAECLIDYIAARKKKAMKMAQKASMN